MSSCDFWNSSRVNFSFFYYFGNYFWSLRFGVMGLNGWGELDWVWGELVVFVVYLMSDGCGVNVRI